VEAPAEVNTAVTTLLNSGLFAASRKINFDPYGKPGGMGTTKATSGQPSGPKQLRGEGYVYPRVKADC